MRAEHDQPRGDKTPAVGSHHAAACGSVAPTGTILCKRALDRPVILAELRIGLRTFYRELELLKKCGVKVRHRQKLYHLVPTAGGAIGRLPFPDPQLSFAEMAELAVCECAAGRRLAALLAAVVNEPVPAKSRSGRATRKER